MKAAVYVRISEDRTGQEAGVARQREDCEQRCIERGWEIVAVHTDNDLSATSGRRRPGFEALMADIDAGRVQVVVAWALDRLQRTRRDEVRLYELCRDRGAVLSLVNGTDLDFSSAAGRFVADSLGSVARLEVEMKSDRQRRAVQQAVQAGKRVGGRRPFGYEQDGVTIRPGEAAAVRSGFTAIISGVPLGEIARTWNRAGHVTGQTRWKGEHRGEPSPWRRDSVRSVLTNPRYAGLRAHLGEIVGPAVWPAIVDESTWRAANEILNDPARRRTPTRGRALLTGLALCGLCARPSTIHAGGSTTRGVRNYRCSATTGHFARRAEPVDDYVEAVIVERLGRDDARELLVDREVPDLPAMREATLALRARLDALAVDFADGSLTASQLRTATERLRANLHDVEKKMADAGRVDLLGPLVNAKDVEVVWLNLSVAVKRAVIDLLCTVTVHAAGRGTRTFRPESVAINWK